MNKYFFGENSEYFCGKKDSKNEPGMVAHICNPSIREAEIGGS
jgi:hypothetical protein